MTTVINVFTSALHLAITPKNPLGSVVYTAIMTEEKITENILKSIVTGMSIRMNHAYNYAKDYYELKLPSGTTTQSNILTDEDLSNLISLNINYPNGVICLESGYEEYSIKLRIIRFLVMDRGYSSVNSIVTKYPGYTDTDLYKVICSSITANTDGLHVDVVYDVYVKTEFIDAETSLSTWDWVREATIIKDEYGGIISSNPTIHTESVLFENTFILPVNTPCFYAMYKKLDINLDVLPQEYIWFYDLTSGLYPELQEPITKFKSDTFLPVIPIRYDNVDLTDVSLEDTDLYKTSKKLLKIANIPFEYLGKQINENPNVAEIDHAYVMFGVDLQTNQPESLHYLNLFFHNVHNLNAYSNYKISKSNGIDFLEYGLNLKITYDDVTSTVIEGMLDVSKLGTTTKVIQLGLDDLLILDTKISDTLIRRVTVKNLVVYNSIYNGYSVVTTLRSAVESNANHNLIIPIQYGIASSMPLIMRNALYTDGTLMVVNSVVITHLKWYQESWFKFVVIIIMVIILVIVIIFSWGSLADKWLLICALIMEGLYIAAIVVILAIMIPILLIAYTAKWLVTTYGAQVGVIGAIVAAVVAIAVQQYSSAMGITSSFMLSAAQTMIQISSALLSSANDLLMATAKQVQSEYDNFLDMMGEKEKDLAEKEAAFELDYDINPLTYLKPARLRCIPNETPDAFFQRTLGLCENTFWILHEEIPEFYTQKLKLPRTVTADMFENNFA